MVLFLVHSIYSKMWRWVGSSFLVPNPPWKIINSKNFLNFLLWCLNLKEIQSLLFLEIIWAIEFIFPHFCIKSIQQRSPISNHMPLLRESSKLILCIFYDFLYGLLFLNIWCVQYSSMGSWIWKFLLGMALELRDYLFCSCLYHDEQGSLLCELS